MSSISPGSKDQVNLLKGYAIFAVVLIHVIGAYIGRFPAGSPVWLGLVGLNQLARFCVPLFVALSGFAMARKYASASPDYFRFIFSRAAKLLPPYLVWSLVYYAVGWLIPSLAIFSRSAPVWELLVFGRAHYHLYFVPMIFQFYLLFPLLLWIVRRFPVLAVLSALFIQIMLYFQTGTPGWSDQEQYFRFFTWIFYFTLGLFTGQQKDLPKYVTSVSGRMVFLVFTLAGFIWTLADGFIRLAAGSDIILATCFTRLPVMLFSTGFFLLSFSLSRPKIFVRPGAWSYQIYLGHIILLQLLSLAG